jgi:hypothetical protein
VGNHSTRPNDSQERPAITRQIGGSNKGSPVVSECFYAVPFVQCEKPAESFGYGNAWIVACVPRRSTCALDCVVKSD